jgi:hypothetical protein
VKDLVVEGEVVAGNDIDTGILLDLPVSKTEALGLSKEVSLRDLAAPVYMFRSAAVICWGRSETMRRIVLTSFGGLLQVTVDTHAGKTENRGLNHFDG